MAGRDAVEAGAVEPEEHQAAYVFDPLAGDDDENDGGRPTKRRKRRKRRRSQQQPRFFVPLFGGAEQKACVRRREQLLDACWAGVQPRLQDALRDANSVTLDQVAAFVRAARYLPADAAVAQAVPIPTALVVTGPNLAARDLLFAQLADGLPRLVGCRTRLVSLRSTDASKLKAALKKIIRDAVDVPEDVGLEAEPGWGRKVTDEVDGDDDDDDAMSVAQNGRKFLSYDLGALHAHVKVQNCEHVVLALPDADGLDPALLADLVQILATWAGRIPFVLVLGVATSVELLQARLPRLALRLLAGTQFDAARAATTIHYLFRIAVAAADIPLRLGPSLLKSLLDRQRDQVVGVQAFVHSIKYAYMSHFYANPMSVFLAHDDDDYAELQSLVQREHIETARTLPQFRARVEAAVDAGRLSEARALLDDDAMVLEDICAAPSRRDSWVLGLLRCLAVLAEISSPRFDFTQAYMQAMADGIDPAADGALVTEPVRRLAVNDLMALIDRVASRISTGDDSLSLATWADQPDGSALLATLAEIRHDADRLRQRAALASRPLRSRYTHGAGTLRATVVAQRVQLSRDTADLTVDDHAFSDLVDALAAVLGAAVRCTAARYLPLQPAWLFDAGTPIRAVFVPRPRLVLDRALRQPQLYLGSAAVPPVALLYQLFAEAGCLVNVADLWAAFRDRVELSLPASDLDHPTTALALFYRALAELKALGYAKPTGRKTDHVAKVKWL